jgi:hypothetical protein
MAHVARQRKCMCLGCREDLCINNFTPAQRPTNKMPHQPPPQPTVTEIKLKNLTTCLTVAANTLEILADGFKTPILGPIFNTTQSLLKYVEVSLFNESVVPAKFSVCSRL